MQLGNSLGNEFIFPQGICDEYVVELSNLLVKILLLF